MGGNGRIISRLRFWHFALPLSVTIALIGAFYATFHPDVGSYFPAALKIAHGEVPGRDFSTGYTPFAFYLWALLLSSSPQPLDYIIIALGNFGLISLATVLLWRLTSRFCSNPGLRLDLSAFFLVSSMLYGGYYPNLEVILVFLLMLLLFFIFSLNRSNQGLHTGFLMGFLVGVGFCTKQYFLSFVPYTLLSLLCLAGWRGLRPAMILSLTFGFLIPIVTFIAQPLGWELDAIVREYIVVHYVRHSWNITEVVLFGVTTLLPVFLTPVAFRSVDSRVRTDMAVLSCGLALSLLPLLMNQFRNYFLTALPFVVLIGALLFENRSRVGFVWRRVLYRSVTIVAVLTLTEAAVTAVNLIRFSARDSQITNSKTISSLVSKDSTAVMLAEPIYFWLCRLEPPVLSEVLKPQFTFVYNLPPNEIRDALVNSDIVITDPNFTYLSLADMALRSTGQPAVFDVLAGIKISQAVGQHGLLLWKRRNFEEASTNPK